MTKRIAIISAWSDDNKGDAAILMGLKALVQHTFANDDLHIDIISHFSSTDPDFAHHHRFVMSVPDQNIRLHSAVFPVPMDKIKNLFRYRLQMIQSVLNSLLVLLLASSLKKRSQHPLLSTVALNSLQALSNADVVVCKGGHEIYTRKGIGSFVAFYIRLFPLLLALRLRRRVVIYGQSVGPVEGTAARWLLRFVLNRCEYVLVREALSHQLILNETGGKLDNHSAVTWDTGFLVHSQPLPAEVAAQLPAQFVAFTLRPWHFPQAPGQGASKYRHYLNTMATLISRIEHEYGLPVVLVPQVTGPAEVVSDYTAWAELRPFLHNDARVIELRSDLSPGQLISVYRGAEFVIGTRFHSVIFAMIAHTPSIAISYDGYKTTGIMTMLNLMDYVVDIDGIDVDLLWSKVKTMRENQSTLIDHLKTQTTQIQQESQATARTVLATSQVTH